jgi:hypothetical protein
MKIFQEMAHYRPLSVQIFLFISCLIVSGQEKREKISVFRDSTDHAIDISDWLVNKKGVLILPTIITEPAIGYGAAVAALYFHSSYSEKKGPPSITGVVGAYTQNGTWLGGVLHAGFWKEDHIRYTGAVARTNANLEFYGSGNLGLIGLESVNLNLDAWILFQQLKFRLGESNLFLGGSYLLLDTKNTFSSPVDYPDFTGVEFSSTLSEASIKFELDSRNNVFTPTKGFFLGLKGTYSDEWFGGDALYGRIGVTLIGYIPAGQKVFFGIRHESLYSLGDIPFYARPVISLRGAPLMKYQNKNTMLMEAEVTYNIYNRWYLSAFTGMGNAFNGFSELEEGKGVSTMGTGFRYLVAKKLGTHMGMDFGFSQDDFAFYIIFGTAWMR